MASPPNNYYRRPLPPGLIDFASEEGRLLFREALASGGMEGWFPLAEHFHTQSEPAFCALGSLVVVLNALAIDPGRTWKGPWRWYSEELLDCCDSLPVVRERGMTLPRFVCLARCNGLRARLRLAESTPVDTLRDDVVRAAAGGPPVILSFGRAVLGQTGDGHYSPVGGWHAARELVLVLDVARFKYPPFWVPLDRLHAATATLDPETGRSRGWVVLEPDGGQDARAWRLACESPGWREQVATLRASLPATPAATAADLVVQVAEAAGPAVAALLVPRPGEHGAILDALRSTPLHAAIAHLPNAAPIVLLTLVAAPLFPPPIRAELEQLRETLPPEARAEVERLQSQLEALEALG